MEYQSGGLSKEEIRKKKRQQERLRVIAIFAAVVLVLCLVVGGIVFALVQIFSKGNDKTEDLQVDAVTTESVTEQPMESADVEEPTESADVEQTDGTEEEPTEDTQAEEVPTEDAQEEGTPAEQTEGDATDTEAESGTEAEEEDDMAQSVLDEILGTEDTQAIEQAVSDKIASMTLEEKVAGLFFVTPEQLMGRESDITAVGSEFGEVYMKYPVGGILLDESNMPGKSEFEGLISNLEAYISPDIFVGVEHQGGEETPFVANGVTENVIASHKEIGESLGAAGAYSAGISLGSELRRFNINVNFTPNVDVAIKPDSVAAKEGFGADMTTTAELGKNLVKGLSDQGISAAVGHFPSYGDVSHDGDSGQLVSNRTAEDLKKESDPYLAAIDAGADFVVISHIGLPKIRGDRRPASLSKEVITDIVRTEWKYDGIVITDFMDRSCMYQHYTYAEAAAGAIEAGADMILSPKNFLKSYNGVLDAVNKGQLTEERINESLRRIYRVKLAAIEE